MDETPEGLIERLNKIIIVFLLENDDVRHFLEQVRINKRMFMLQEIDKINISWQAIIESVLYYADGIDEMRSDIKDNPEFNDFINIIFRVIVGCPPIKHFVHSIDKNWLTLLDGASVHIELEKFITDVISSMYTRPKLIITRGDTAKNTLQERRVPRQSIDGKVLTPNEVAFAEFCAERFDEKDWLEKHKIMLEPLEQEEKREKRKRKNEKPLLYSI